MDVEQRARELLAEECERMDCPSLARDIRDGALSFDNEVAIRAIARALEQPAAGGWRPIETAPRDGTSVLWGRRGWAPQQGNWANGPVFLSEYDEHSGYLEPSFYPTHWMPLPPPPSASTSRAGMTEDGRSGGVAAELEDN